MNLFTQLLSKKESKEFFLILGIEENYIRAAVTQVTESGINLLGSSEKSFLRQEDITETVDIAISETEKFLPEGELIRKVIFVLPVNCLDDDAIKTDYLTFLSNLSKELDLKPFGYIDYPTAISYLFEKNEGSPPTLLLISIGKENLDISFIRVGKLYQYVTYKRTENIITDFETAIKDINSDILPSRLILYNKDRSLETIKEEFLKIPWHKQASFLHTPKIETLSSQQVFDAMIESTGSSVVKTLQLEHTVMTDNGTSNQINGSPQLLEEKKIEPEMPLPSSDKNLFEKNLEKETFGFQQKNKTISAQDFSRTGVEKRNIMSVSPTSKVTPNTLVTIPVDHQSKPSSVQTVDNDEVSAGRKRNFSLSGIRFSTPVYSFSYGLIILLILSILLILEVVYSFTQYPKTTIGLYVYPRVASHEAEVTFIKEGQKNSADSKYSVSLSSFSETTEGEKTILTTGKTKVGDKAQGELIIYNKTASAKTFSKGTVVNSGKLSFLLNNDVRIASASDTGEGLIFGKSNVEVTAASIGTESNMPQDSVFSFKDFSESSFVAKNPKPLSGGSSRNISSISKEDRDRLEKELTDELVHKIIQNITQKQTPEYTILQNTFTTEKTKKVFSGEIGEESKELNLKLTVKLTGSTYNIGDLKKIAENIGVAVPQGFKSDSNRFSYSVHEIKENKNGLLTAKMDLKKYFIPEIDQKNILSSVAGKKYEQAQDILKQIDSVAGMKIIKVRDMSFLQNQLPFNRNNITLTIVEL